MRTDAKVFFGTRFVWSLIICGALAACSTNAGFGPPPPNAPVNQQLPQSGATPCAPGAPCPSPSPAASATPVPLPSVDPQSTLALDALGLRIGYDARASDPVKADRYVVATFAVKNNGKLPASISAARVIRDGKQLAEFPLAQTIPGDRTSPVRVVAVRVKGKLADLRQFVIALVGDNKQLVAAAAKDAGGREYDTTPLDPKKPAGPVSVDGMEVTGTSADGKGPFFEVTFAVTNATADKVELTGLTITPPKSSPYKVALPLTLEPRSTTGFITLVVRFDGKTLPAGDYLIEANGSSSTPVAKATAALL